MKNGENIFRSVLEGARIHLFDPEKSLESYFGSELFIQEWHQVKNERPGFSPLLSKADHAEILGIDRVYFSKKNNPFNKLWEEYVIT